MWITFTATIMTTCVNTATTCVHTMTTLQLPTCIPTWIIIIYVRAYKKEYKGSIFRVLFSITYVITYVITCVHNNKCTYFWAKKREPVKAPNFFFLGYEGGFLRPLCYQLSGVSGSVTSSTISLIFFESGIE